MKPANPQTPFEHQKHSETTLHRTVATSGAPTTMIRHLFYSLCLLTLSQVASLHAQYEALIQSDESKPEVIVERKRQEAMGPLRLIAPSSHALPLLGMDLSNDGKYLLTYDQSSLKIWDVAQRVPFIEKELSETIRGVYFTSKPRQVCVISAGAVTYYDEFNFIKYKWLARTSTSYSVAHFYDADEDAVFILQRSAYFNPKTSEHISLTLSKTSADLAGKIEIVDKVSVPLNSFGKYFDIRSPDSNWKLSLSPDRTKALFSVSPERPSLEIDLSSQGATSRFFTNLPIPISYLPDGDILAMSASEKKWIWEILASETMESIKSIATATPNLSLIQRLNIPHDLKQPLLLPISDGCALYDFSTKQTTTEIRPVGKKVNAALIMGDSKVQRTLVAVSDTSNFTKLQFFDPKLQVFRGDWTDQAWTPESIHPQLNRFDFVAVRGSEARLIQLTDSGLAIRRLPQIPVDFKNTAVVIPEKNGNLYYIDGKSPRVAIVDPSEGDSIAIKTLSSPRYSHGGYSYQVGGRKAHVVTPDGRKIAMQYHNRTFVIDTESDEYSSFNTPTSVTWNGEPDPRVAISDDGSKLLYGYVHTKDNTYQQNLTLYDFDSKQQLWSISENIDDQLVYNQNIRFTDGGRSFVAVEHLRGKLARFQVLDGSKITELDDYYKMIGPLSFSAKSSMFAQLNSNTIVRQTLPDGKEVDRIKLITAPDDIQFLGGSNFILAHDLSTSSIQLVDCAQGQVVADLYLFETPKRWLVRNPDTGLFTSSDEAHKSLYYVRGDQINPLVAYFDQFYRPRLLGSLINGLSPKPVIKLDDLRYAPRLTLTVDGPQQRGLTVEDEFETVEVATDTVTLMIDAKCEGTPIKDIRIYQNGKLVTGGTRGLFVEDDEEAPADETFTKKASFTFPLAEGKNRFRAIAINEQETESIPDELIVYSSEAEVNAPKGMSLHLFIVGINEYTNPDYNLNYAVADAEAINQLIQANSKSLYTKVNSYTLKNAEANRENIIGILENIKSEASPRDSFIFYFAGHGVVSEDENADFFLAPAEMTQLYGDRRELQKKGISSFELLEYSRDIAAQKQLFILDACQSEGALKTVAQRGAAEEQAIAQLARSTGTHWLTATGSDQTATEFDKLGHGAFTYTLLEALKGAADTGDGIISVNELKAYIEAKVPEVTEEHKGTAQYPASYGYGQDFPISLAE